MAKKQMKSSYRVVIRLANGWTGVLGTAKSQEEAEKIADVYQTDDDSCELRVEKVWATG